MKVKNLFYVSLAALSLAACSNDEEANIPQEGSVVINLTTSEPKTKADPDPDTTEGYADENAMNTGKVYAFLDGTTLVETKAFSTGSNSVEFTKLTQGRNYQFVAVANSEEAAATADGFKTIEIEAPTKKENFVMYEVASVASLGATNNIDMTVKRVLSAVQLATVVRTQTEGVVPSLYTKADMQIESLTLYNVNPSVQLDGDKKDGVKEKATDLAAEFTGKVVKNTETLNIGGTTVKERAYACPTAGADDLYAVLAVKYLGIGDKGADVTKYFNIVLNKGLDANTLYALNVTITGVGSDAGGDPDEFGTATGTITPAPWSNGSVINVENQEN